MRKAELAAATLADPRWPVVLHRDAKADGEFLFAVKTTGIYCRPSCSARTPRPENVRFFTRSEEARAAGFRACLRCKPDSPTLAEEHATLVARLCRHIEAAETPPSLDTLAGLAGMSPTYLHRVFKAVTGLTPKAFGDAVRAARMRSALATHERITDAVYSAGFNSPGRFYAQATQALGMSPLRYRKGGADCQIRFAIAECSLGSVLVATSELGVCAILFGDDPELLIRDLEQRFPHAGLLGGDAGFERTVAQVLGFIEAPGLGLDLPLDLRGTAFQQRVWQALRGIPAGRTASYAEVATAIGMPRASRAVAQACAANPLAVAVPCHRVVRQDGGLSGYRWGVARKQLLLAREATDNP